MNKALIIERKVNEAHVERERNQKKRNRFGGTQRRNQNNKVPAKKPATDKNRENVAARCSRCGRREHETSNCPWNTGSCFRCGQKGHKIADCPQMDENRSTQAKDGGQRPKTQGRIYALTQQDAQASNAVVTGTIPVSGIHASVLFDSDATHSFISTTFIRQHDIVCEPMKIKLYIETPVGGILSTENVCKSCSIRIGERELPTNLVVLDMHDFDIILGMDWLATCWV